MGRFSRTASVSATIALAAALFACGGDDDDASAGSEPPATESRPGTDDSSASTSGGSDADASSNPLQGKTITFIVPFDPGGGYDQYARLMAPHLEDELGATVVVRNEPGAGGLAAMNDLQNAEPDGTHLVIFGFQAIASGIGGAEGVAYDVDKLGWIGRIVGDPEVTWTRAESEFTDWASLSEAEEITWASSGAGATFWPTVVSQAFELPIEIVTGFQGGGDIETAILRGDVDLHNISLASAGPLVDAGDARMLAIWSTERSEDYPDVPTALELEMDEDGRALVEAAIGLAALARNVATAPGTPPEILDALRTAFDNTMANPDFLAETEAAERAIDPIPGAQVEAMIQELYAEGGELIEVIRSVYSQ